MRVSLTSAGEQRIREVFPRHAANITEQLSVLTPVEQEELGRLVDTEQVARAAVERVQGSGILFIDEIDKIAGREGGHGPDVSREGVQRDILPIVEGTAEAAFLGPCRVTTVAHGATVPG